MGKCRFDRDAACEIHHQEPALCSIALAELETEAAAMRDELVLLREQCLESPAFAHLLNKVLVASLHALEQVAEAARIFARLNIDDAFSDDPDNRPLWDCCGTMLRLGDIRKLRDALAALPLGVEKTR